MRISRTMNRSSTHHLKVIFAGNFQETNGSSQVVYNYFLSGKTLGIDVVMSDLGPVEPTVARFVPVVHGTGKADLLVLVFESTMYISERQLLEIERSVSRTRRIIIDADGKYPEFIRLSDDRNHRDAETAQRWKNKFDALSDVILQPRLS